MNSFSRFVIFLLFCIGFIGCSLVPNELKIAEKLIDTAPDSALHILQHLSPDKYKSDESRALYGLLMIHALDNKKLPLKSDSSLDFSIEYYKNHKVGDRLAMCYLYKGRFYKYKLQYEKAMSFYLKALDAINDERDFALLGRVNFDMGDIYNVQNDFSLARQKYKTAYGYLKQTQLQPQAFYSLLNIGRTYHAAKQYKNAQVHYQRIFSQAKDSLQKGALFQEMGLNYSDFKKPDSALFYYRKILNYPYISNNRALRNYLLADLFFSLKQVDSAFIYASNSFKYESDIRIQRECYRILTNSEYLRGNMSQMSFYMNKYVQLGDSLRKVDAQTKGSYIETMHDTKLEFIKTKNKLGYLVGIIILGILAVFFVIRRLRKRSKMQLQEKEETHLQQKAGYHQEVLFKKRDALQTKIENKKAAQSAQWKIAGLDQRCKMDLQLYEELLHFSDIPFFYKEMDTVLNNLVTKLQTGYPTLNTKEVQWCCLHLLNISVVDIMLLLGYNVEGLKKMRQRLAKKVNVHYVSQLDNFLNNMLLE